MTTTGYTRHGHAIDGVPQTGKPERVARCGGPGLCGECSAEAVGARRRYELETGKTLGGTTGWPPNLETKAAPAGCEATGCQRCGRTGACSTCCCNDPSHRQAFASDCPKCGHRG